MSRTDTIPTNQTIPDAEGTTRFFDWLRTMRDERPVWDEDARIVHVFRHADVQRVITDPEAFSNDSSRLVPQIAPITRGNINSMDPPQHRLLRRLASRAFTPGVVAALEPRIVEVTEDLLDRVPDGGFDLVQALTHPLPVIVIAELLGVPAADRDLFRTWVDQLLDLPIRTGPQEPDFLEVYRDATAEMDAYLLEHCRERRARPRADLISRLAHAEVDGERLDDEQLVKFAAVLFHTGHVTTTLLIGNAVQCLDEAPDIARELRSTPSLVPAAVEETMRFRSPFTTVSRVTTREVEVGGTVVDAGRMVSPWIVSANHDERVFADPERFDLHRAARGETAHVAFGHGIHFCLGAPLARLEGRVALAALLRRFRDLRVDRDEPIPYHPVRGMLGARALPVRVRPA